MNIEFMELKDLQNAIEALTEAIRNINTSKVVEEVKKEAPVKKAVTPKKVEEPPIKVEEPEDYSFLEEPVKVKITKEELASLMAEKGKALGSPTKIKDIIVSYKVSKLSEIPEELYHEVFEKVKAL